MPQPTQVTAFFFAARKLMGRHRTIAVMTGSRAEFGLLETVMHAIDDHPSLRLKTIVGGLHLTMGTWRDVARAGFEIHHRISMQRKGEVGRHADVMAMSRGIAGFGKAFDSVKPDAVVVLGDRIEAFAAASAASVGGYRVAHIHGGDRAEGVADEAMRHAISKLAHLHFAATATSQRRLIRMGELPGRVIKVGSPAIDALQSIRPVQSNVGVIVMFHPIGEGDQQAAKHMRNVMKAVRQSDKLITDASGTTHYFFNPNTDPGSAGIVGVLDKLVPLDTNSKKSPPSFTRVKHLPRPEFLALLSSANAIVGNSSAGLIEAATLKVPCVNIGPRQNGREKPGNVIDCDNDVSSIIAAMKRALQLNLRRLRHPYGNGQTGQTIANHLATVNLEEVTVRKQNAY